MKLSTLYFSPFTYMLNFRFGDVDLKTGVLLRPIFDSLQAFYPGLLTLVGDVTSAGDILNSFLSVQRSLDAGIPEEFDFLRWQLPSTSSGGRKYPLRQVYACINRLNRRMIH